MKKTVVRLAVFILFMASLMTINAKAAEWRKDSTGWWWQEDDRTYPRDSWRYIHGFWYLFDSRGYMRTGWAYTGNQWYYLEGSGAMASSRWVGDYYLTGSGAMARNTWVGGYYVNGSGKWVPDRWVHSSGGWWYRRGDGSYPTGWAFIGGTWYYFDSAGWMKTGWIAYGGDWYYMTQSGAMATNIWVGNYYLTDSGAMARDTWVGPYYVDGSGSWNPNVSTSVGQKAAYSYGIYLIKGADEFFDSGMSTIFIRTNNPDPNSISLEYEGRGDTYTLNQFDNVKAQNMYTKEGYLIASNKMKVEGGYIWSISFKSPGQRIVTVKENNIVVGSFTVNVKSYVNERNRQIDAVLSKVTTPEMNPDEKMNAFCSYIYQNYRYYTMITTSNGSRYARLLGEWGSPWWVSKQLNSYVSPALLCVVAERIGGFTNIHNYYGDYQTGTPEWQTWHYWISADYNGKKYYYQACPSTDTAVKYTPDIVPIVNFEEGSPALGAKLF